MQQYKKSTALYVCAALAAGAAFPANAQDSAPTRQEVEQLRQENRVLQNQLKKQQETIEALAGKVDRIQRAGEGDSSRSPDTAETAGKPSPGFGFGKVNISGEGGVGFFESGLEGMFPNSEFRVDEAKLFVEAPVWNDVYFFSEINLMTRHSLDVSLQLGEVYLDFENVSRLWHRDRMLNLRIGRTDVPFGEEYIYRDAIDNPLISHSLTDFWGVDEGIEIYGSIGGFSYVAAVQNGGASGVRDYDGDKAIVGRLSYDPVRWLHLSASGMRTGNLRPPGDYWSELYFANGWFVPLSGTPGTRYHAELAEGDVAFRLPRGHVKLFGGGIRYDDADPVNKRRNLYYYSIEAVQNLTPKLYAAARFGQIFAPKGYPIAGNGDMGEYLFSGALTEEIWRLTMGLGYRFSSSLILKAEYSLERGRQIGGERRNHEDFAAIEAVFKF